MTSPTEPTISAVARKFKLEVDTGTAGVPAWTPVFGITDFKPNVTPNLEDDGVYDDEGWGSSTKTGLAWSLEPKIVRRRAVDDAATYDPGQEALRTRSLLFGAEGIAHVRYYDRDGGPEAYEGYAEVTWAADGGKRTDLETVSITLTGRGALTAIANPSAAAG